MERNPRSLIQTRCWNRATRKLIGRRGFVMMGVADENVPEPWRPGSSFGKARKLRDSITGTPGNGQNQRLSARLAMVESGHSRTMESKSNFSVGYALLVATSCLLLGLSGCAASHLKADYNRYEDAFAYTSNHEMLLNLARLNQHDPTYFFKLGQIGTSYRMQVTLPTAGELCVCGQHGRPVGRGNCQRYVREGYRPLHLFP